MSIMVWLWTLFLWDVILLSEQCPDVSKYHKFFMLKGLDVPVSWTCDDGRLQCFEILGIAHPVIWCYISEAHIADMQST
jgi:hypothetical protein